MISLNRTQQQIQKAVTEFIRGEFKKEIIDQLVETHTFPRDILKKAGELGLIGLHFPEDYNGQDLGLFETVLVAEALCRGDSSVGGCLASAAHGADLILRYGSEDQRQAWLPGIAEGELLTGLATAEPGPGIPLEQGSTTAVYQDGHWVINGTKTFVVNGDQAQGFLVLCRTDPTAASPDKAFSIILVERDREGMEVTDVGSRLGRRLLPLSQIRFTGVRVPAHNLLGKEHRGLPQLQDCLGEIRILAAAQALGMALGAFDRALSHVRQREQFGRKLVDFQITRKKLADMATKIEAARLLTYQAAVQFQTDRRNTRRQIAMAKLHACRTAYEVCDEAIQLLGGYGYIQEYEVERYFRDAKTAELFEGPPLVQQEIIAADLIKGRRF